jgi:hypothetical protein
MEGDQVGEMADDVGDEGWGVGVDGDEALQAGGDLGGPGGVGGGTEEALEDVGGDDGGDAFSMLAAKAAMRSTWGSGVGLVGWVLSVVIF